MQKEMENLILELKISRQMKDLFFIQIDRNYQENLDFIKYFSGDDGFEIFNEGLMNFNFYDEKELKYYRLFFNQLLKLCKEEVLK